MAGITISQKTNEVMLDFVRAAYPRVATKEFSAAAQTYQNYICSDWFKGDRVKQETGSYLTWPILWKKLASNARHVRMFE